MRSAKPIIITVNYVHFMTLLTSKTTIGFTNKFLNRSNVAMAEIKRLDSITVSSGSFVLLSGIKVIGSTKSSLMLMVFVFST